MKKSDCYKCAHCLYPKYKMLDMVMESEMLCADPSYDIAVPIITVASCHRIK